jgi:hypothetical protein
VEACCLDPEVLSFDLGERLLFSPSPQSEIVQARTIKLSTITKISFSHGLKMWCYECDVLSMVMFVVM